MLVSLDKVVFYRIFDDVSTLIRPFDMPKLVQNAIKVRFATKLTPEFEEFRNACGMIFVERFKGILSNHVNISKLPQNVKDDLRERMFPLGLTLQLMKMSKLKTLEAQIKYFGGNTNNTFIIIICNSKF